MQLV
jgi:hypothetical protein